ELLSNFISDSQIRCMSPPVADQDEWQSLGFSKWEHARWINGWLASDLFNLKPTATSFINLGKTKSTQHAFAALDSRGSFVAFLKPNGVILELIDREELLESLAAETRLKLAAAIVSGDVDSPEGLLDPKKEGSISLRLTSPFELLRRWRH